MTMGGRKGGRTILPLELWNPLRVRLTGYNIVEAREFVGHKRAQYTKWISETSTRHKVYKPKLHVVADFEIKEEHYVH